MDFTQNDTPAARQFLNWLSTRHPRVYGGLVRRAGHPAVKPRPAGAGMGGLGGMGGILDDITGALNDVTSTVSTVAGDKALISYNLERAKQGLPPVDKIPTATTGVTVGGSLWDTLMGNKWMLAGLGVAALGVGYLVFGGSRKGRK